MTKLQELADIGQSVWYDFIKRDMLIDGTLNNLIAEGVMGITSNPSIFEKAISGSDLYDDDMKKMDLDKPVINIYENIAKKDIRIAAEKMLSVYNGTDGLDSYVSLEVNPKLAYKTDETIDEAVRLFSELNMPNIMIKVPATSEGIPAVRALIARGINVNVTLIFSIENYLKVARAYIDGLNDFAAKGGDVSKVASVASFFVSRVDSAVDKLLEKNGRAEYLGKAAVANSKIAYKEFLSLFSGDNWKSLENKGARVQRLLWASTSTKNPNYSDILYVQELIGKPTVNTMPPDTVEAFLDHGEVRETLSGGIDEAERIIEAIENSGISMKEVTQNLQTEGVKAFADAFDKLLNSLEGKIKAIKGN